MRKIAPRLKALNDEEFDYDHVLSIIHLRYGILCVDLKVVRHVCGASANAYIRYRLESHGLKYR